MYPIEKIMSLLDLDDLNEASEVSGMLQNALDFLKGDGDVYMFIKASYNDPPVREVYKSIVSPLARFGLKANTDALKELIISAMTPERHPQYLELLEEFGVRDAAIMYYCLWDILIYTPRINHAKGKSVSDYERIREAYLNEIYS